MPALTRAAGASGERRSAGNKVASLTAATSASTLARAASSRAASTSFVLSRASRSAMARPIPRLAPVTMAIFPASVGEPSGVGGWLIVMTVALLLELWQLLHCIEAVCCRVHCNPDRVSDRFDFPLSHDFFLKHLILKAGTFVTSTPSGSSVPLQDSTT